jgi:multisubunit Na+/H+ antiporter MnhE subunit
LWALLNWVPDWQHLVVGAAIAAAMAFLMEGLFVRQPSFRDHPRRWGLFVFVFLPMLLRGMARSVFLVALRVLRPDPSLRSALVETRTEITTDAGLAFLAVSLTLATPALVVDVDKTSGVLVLHWLHAATGAAAEARMAVARFEKILKVVFT